MTENKRKEIQPADKKLGILIVGLGAVTTTFLAGIEAIRRNRTAPVGSLALNGKIRMGKRSENRHPMIKDVISLAELDDLEFLAWDPIPDNAFEAAERCGVLKYEDLQPLKEFLSGIKPHKAVFKKDFVKKLNGTHIKNLPTHREHIAALKEDINNFKKEKNVDRLVLIWSGSTEIYCEPTKIHQSLEAYEKALDENDPQISPSQLYTYAAVSEGIPYVNGAPNLSCDFPAMVELAEKTGAPIAGKDFKTGQTLMKTIIAPGLKARMLGLQGWFSTNILGNRDGEVLDDPDSFKSKEVSKLSVLESILDPERYPELYKDFYHKVRINYYPPRGDNKEGWDNIDIRGWMNYDMQIKIDFLARDSILAAPLMLDLVLFSDFAKRAGLKGVQEWLSFYLKSPQAAPGLEPEHDLFIQQKKLKNTIRYLVGEELITHLGNEYYGF